MKHSETTNCKCRSEMERKHRKIQPLSDFRFADKNHSKFLLQGFNQLWKTRTLCDVTLKAGPEHRGFTAHRQVLAAFSPYFKNLLAAEEPTSVSRDIVLPDISSDALDALVDYIYTGSLTLTTENSRDIFQCSLLLQLESLKNVCIRYLEKCITEKNCLQTMALGEKHRCRELSDAARTYAEANFARVVHTDAFPNTEAKDLKAIISNDDLRVENEDEVYLAVKKWIELDFENRLKYVPFLMSHVRFRFMSRHFLKGRFRQDSIMAVSQLSQDFVHEALMYETLSPQEKQHVHTARVKPRWCFQRIEVILLLGGVCRGNELGSSQWAFDPLTGRWYTSVASLLSTRHHFALALCDDKLYVFGGSVSEQADISLATVEVYDPKLNQLQAVSKQMRKARSRFDAVVVGETIYFVGGICNDPHRNTLEIYYPPLGGETQEETQSCSNRLSLPQQPRYDHCTVVLKGKIYFIGGYTRGHPTLNTVECYDPDQDTWSYVAPLLVPRSGACAVVLDDHIIVIGGANERKPLNSCEIYDPNEDQWEYITPMNERRDRCTAECFRNKIYVFGGSYGRIVHTSVECYTAKTNKWRVVSHLPAAKYGFKCALFAVNRSLVREICFEQV